MFFFTVKVNYCKNGANFDAEETFKVSRLIEVSKVFNFAVWCYLASRCTINYKQRLELLGTS